MSQELVEPTFGIGSVSRLTGIPMDTLRIWERRYNAVTPQRTETNRRCYTREDVARLALVKQLVDFGHGVSSVIHLPETALRERLRVHADLDAERPPQTGEAGCRARVMVYGDSLPFLVGHWRESLRGLEILGLHAAYADFERAVLELQPEVIVAEFPALQGDAAAALRDLAQRGAVARTVVVFGFAPAAVLARLAKQGVVALRAPVTAEILRDACLLPGRLGGETVAEAALALAEAGVPPRRFDAATLVAITGTVPRIKCECPHHLADLVSRIGAFERYSADCENRNEADALLHARLYRAAGQARGLLEEALEFLLRSEGIDAAALVAGEAGGVARDEMDVGGLTQV